ncbi:MAG: response regulator [Prevotella sp.]|nr:response regulator [Prevotella sp.]MBR3480525.1 response regulator [Prevotella sp.]MBR6188895.1 response regulator [Prevotella sp.]
MMNQDEKELLLLKYAEVNHRLNMANEQLEQANKKLKEYEEKALKAENASRMKSLFLANMSHEIRTPLNAIEGFANIIALTDSAEERMNYMEIIESNSRRLLDLLNEILDLSRAESGEIVIKKYPTDLNQLMSSIKQLFKFRCPDTVALTTFKPESVISMVTDENRITQVLSNLISNALKHTAKGTINFGYNLKNENTEIEFFVSDTGSGIDPKFIDHIFETYASKDAEQNKGYGLGLALCRIIVEKMEGHIEVKSELDKGSTFTFTLPFHGTIGGMSVSRRDFASTQNSLRVSSKSEQYEKRIILVAEDEESNFQLVQTVLKKRHHYVVIRAHNGIEAVTLNEEEKPDLILMDIRMPDMNGLDATRIIKEVSHETPVVAVSAYAFQENIREAKAAGCDDFLAKPFRPEDLLMIVEKYVGR